MGDLCCLFDDHPTGTCVSALVLYISGVFCLTHHTVLSPACTASAVSAKLKGPWPVTQILHEHRESCFQSCYDRYTSLYLSASNCDYRDPGFGFPSSSRRKSPFSKKPLKKGCLGAFILSVSSSASRLSDIYEIHLSAE